MVIGYGSDRQLCEFGEGTIAGIADSFGTPLQTTQHRCMLENGQVCEFQVTMT